MNSSASVVSYLPEPELRFGLNQTIDDPRTGLFAFGPLSERKPAQMRVGVVGTSVGIGLYKRWVADINGFVPPAKADSPHHIAFPGFEAVFRTPWSVEPVVEIGVSELDISKSLRLSDRHMAIYETVSLYSNPIQKRLHEDDLQVDLWFVIIPEEVFLLGRPQSRVRRDEQIRTVSKMNSQLARKLRVQPSLFAEDMKAADIYEHDLDFHHQLKARLLSSKAVVQIVREPALATDQVDERTGLKRRMQDPATVAWNLCATAFFKAGGRPWKLAHVRERVCYIGLVFKKSRSGADSRNACCGAQMFLDSGDGLVFKGAMGPWYSPDTKEFHLTKDEAQRLVETVVRSYIEETGAPPNELFIHGRTRFNQEEWDGFRAAAPPATNVVCIRIRRTRDMKLFRDGTTPVLRGTMYRVNKKRALIWTMGYIPFLATYPGREVPNPLSIEVSQGEADIQAVAHDILRLTKLNFNACIYGDGLPVTLRFADAVGEILMAAPNDNTPPLPFRHYI